METRERQYPFRLKANRFKRPRRPDEPGNKSRVRTRDDPGGSGREIVREVALCPPCAAAAAAEDSQSWRRGRGPPVFARAA